MGGGGLDELLDAAGVEVDDVTVSCSSLIDSCRSAVDNTGRTGVEFTEPFSGRFKSENNGIQL